MCRPENVVSGRDAYNPTQVHRSLAPYLVSAGRVAISEQIDHNITVWFSLVDSARVMSRQVNS